MRWRAEVSRLMVPVAAPAARRGGLSCARQRRPDVRRHATLPQSWIQRENWQFETHSHGDAKMELFDYIEVFYNQRRRHSTLGQISPADFERQAAA